MSTNANAIGKESSETAQRKRKRKHSQGTSTPEKYEKHINPQQNKKQKSIKAKKSKSKSNGGHGVLSGLTLAVSTLDKGAQHANNDDSYKSVCAFISEKSGAELSNQISKKVFAVICNPSAVSQATQKVRKAVKKGAHIIDVQWVRDCVEDGEKLDFEGYMLDKMLPESARQQAVENNNNEKIASSVDQREITSSSVCREASKAISYVKTIQLDCCCVCHENGTLDCPWCTECNVTLARLQKDNGADE